MSVGEKIRAARVAQGKTQKEIGKAAGMADSAIRKYESGSQIPKTETLQRIAKALGVPVYTLMEDADGKRYLSGCFWTVDLGEKLKQIGYGIGTGEGHEEIFTWLNYPDGTLEVSEDELKELNDSANAFLRFKLDELKNKNASRFRPNTKKPPQP
ncbi:MAG: helix-turn-helix transcriptional regulator [Oscillospiraceae bacterium]|nr:helix-turn-helix transcriptional regulator [Oscillospiraceae bacterium]